MSRTLNANALLCTLNKKGGQEARARLDDAAYQNRCECECIIRYISWGSLRPHEMSTAFRDWAL